MTEGLSGVSVEHGEEKGESLTKEQIEALRKNIELRQRRMDKTLEKIEELDAAIQAAQRFEEKRKQNQS